MKTGNLAFFVPPLGCPYHCSFCDQTCITGSRRIPSADEVIRTAREQAQGRENQTAHTEIAFFGGSFTLIPRPVMTELLAAGAYCVQNFGYKGIRLSTRPDGISPEMIKTLLSFGVTAVELGAQSMEDEVLRKNGRGHTAQNVVDAAEQIRSAGIELGLQMMTGLPGDTMEGALKTADKLLHLSPATVRIYPAIVLPGTHLADWYRQGTYIPQSLEEAVSLCARLIPLFEENGCRVIRVGLHDEAGVRDHHLAGPYHPAFGELCRSRIYRNRMEKQLFTFYPAGSYTVFVSPQDLSIALGQKKENLAYWKDFHYNLRIVPDAALPRGEFRICSI